MSFKPGNDNDIQASIKELKNQVNYLILSNENINHKLEDQSKKEAYESVQKINSFKQELKSFKKNMDDKTNELIQELKKDNEEIKLKLRSMEIRLSRLEKRNLSIMNDDTMKSQNLERFSHIRITYDNRSEHDWLDRIIKNNKLPFGSIVEINKNENEYEIYDMKWIKRNTMRLLNNCSKIVFVNVESLDIEDAIVISSNVTIESETKMNLNFRNSASMIIDHKIIVMMKNVNIKECKYGDNFLIELKNGSSLDLNNSIVEDNLGSQTLMHVSSNASLNLNEIIFRNNILKKAKIPSCIICEKEGKISIYKCEFINHVSKNELQSGFIIENQGTLDVMSTIFEDNKTKKDELASILCFNNAKININDIKYHYCSYMSFEQCHSIQIKNSSFLHNISNSGGGCFHIEQPHSIKIEKCEFKKNKSSLDGGAMKFQHCRGSFTIRECLFEDNHSGSGSIGGALSASDVDLNIVDSIFYKNLSLVFGGGIGVSHSTITCGNCTFEENIAKEGGGAISLYKSSLVQSDENVFVANRPLNDANIFTET